MEQPVVRIDYSKPDVPWEDDSIIGLLFPDAEAKSSGIIIKSDYYSRNFNRTESEPQELKLSLLKKHHSLWGEYIYNAARVLSDRIDAGLIDCKGKRCLELGAGAGLPGIVAALNGASHSVISDYGTSVDRDLIDVIDMNIDSIKSYLGPAQHVIGSPFIFGENATALLSLTDGLKYDIVIMADLIFNRSEHSKLLATLRDCLMPGTGEGHIAFSHHDPLKDQMDLNFFELAEKKFGFNVTRVGEEIRKSYPFVQNDGLDERRGVVNLYVLTLVHVNSM